jgi:NodT family efflux transporter outer membrane factor (OMF) lipoprotein
MSRQASAPHVWPFLLVAGALLGAGCAVGPEFQRPAAPSFDRYGESSIVLPGAGDGQVRQRLLPGATAAAQWWHAFDSVALNDTVDLALRGSPTLEAARATLAAANETLAATRGAIFPQLDLNAAASRGNGSGLAGTATTVTPRNFYSIGAAVDYNVDVFGGTRRKIEQQAALTDYQRGLVGASYLTLTGNVVTAAINAASAAEELDAADEIIAVDKHNLQLVQQSAAAGKSAGTDVLAAEGQLASDRALVPPLRQQLDVARHALAILAGHAPVEWSPPQFHFANLTLPTDLPLTLPSELVRTRPDILAAEAQVHAATAAVGVATAQLYPSLNLSGSWTSAAPESAELFSAASRLWSVAAGVTAPLFHGGTLRAGRRAALDTLGSQLAQYRQTVLQAFGQVADALNALQHDAETIEAEQAALETLRASLELTQQSFAAGQASFLQVLEAQRLYQQARLGIARAESSRYLDTILFFLAVGGDVTRQPALTN